MRYASLLLLLTVGADNSATAPETQETGPYRLTELVSSPQAGEGFALVDQEWLVLEPRLDYRVKDDGATFIATGPPGTYVVRHRAYYCDWEEQTFRKDNWKAYTITIRGPPVVVEPVDPVDPVDPVTPVETPARVVIVYESSSARIPLPVYAAREALNNRGIPMRVVDKDVETGTGSIPQMVADAIRRANEVGLPAVVVMDADNKILRAGTLPYTASEIVNFVMGDTP